MTREEKINIIEQERIKLQTALNNLISIIGDIQISNIQQMPYGWRNSAKGRTVWRIIEEIISQNLEKYATELNFSSVKPSESEIGVYDFEFTVDGKVSYVNIKSSVLGGRENKDDISKADGLINFYKENINKNLYIAKFGIIFNNNMTISISECVVFSYWLDT